MPLYTDLRSWAVSAQATSMQGDTIVYHHGVFLVLARDEQDAKEKGLQVAKKGWSRQQGFADHHVVVCPETHVLDPEKEIYPTE